jgi:enoyl-CoA hydratase/carnithine racemase
MAFVRIASGDGVERWTIARAERGNALGTTVAAELSRALNGLATRLAGIRVLVIDAEPVVKGARRTWIAGGDLKELAAIESRDDARAYAASLAGFLDKLDELPIPVVMAVDGAAIGGGAELALGGDVRLAAAGSTWDFKQLRVGLTTGYASCARLVRMVGAARAQGLIFLGETVDCEEARRLGLAHRVGALGTLVSEVVEGLKGLSPEALAGQKALFRIAAGARDAAAELDVFAATWRNPRHAQFLAAFSGKGEP